MAAWSDGDVARRWLRLFPKQRKKNGDPVEPEEADINAITKNKERLTEVRGRLSDISWWMRCTAENIARRSNKEDECRGHFWEGRYKAQLILDDASLLACAAYVDLNPVRAGLAATPEQSDFTSVKERIADLKAADDVSSADAKDVRIEHGENAGWLAPVELEPKRKKVRETSSARRASNRGCAFMSLAEYLQLLDWTGRQLRPGKRGAVAKTAPPILERLNLSPELWLQVVEQFGKRRAANRVTPASRFNATGKSVRLVSASR